MLWEKFQNLILLSDALKLRIDGDFLILSEERTNSLVYLSGVSKDFFLLIDGQLNLAQIAAVILSEYDVKEALLHDDLCCLVRDLQWKRLIRLKDSKSIG